MFPCSNNHGYFYWTNLLYKRNCYVAVKRKHGRQKTLSLTHTHKTTEKYSEKGKTSTGTERSRRISLKKESEVEKDRGNTRETYLRQ